ncbi:hypothetical protein CoNPh10_CDS0139 [Staphylococcus phage S-CoN_Ph10]|nr:hypothetical protein CoNPh10_CDS0139 [Staphylococcus phage S-CoN_Ph10]
MSLFYFVKITFTYIGIINVIIFASKSQQDKMATI